MKVGDPMALLVNEYAEVHYDSYERQAFRGCRRKVWFPRCTARPMMRPLWATYVRVGEVVVPLMPHILIDEGVQPGVTMRKLKKREK